MPISSNNTISPTAAISHPDLVNIYGCSIEAETKVGPFVEIQAGVRIGARCKIQSHSFICEGVEIGNGVFIGHGVVFTNDRHPRAVLEDGSLVKNGAWVLEPTVSPFSKGIATPPNTSGRPDTKAWVSQP